MKILIINQPKSNYGDLAAHRSLMRSLAFRCPQAKVKVLFLAIDEENITKMKVTSAQYIKLSGNEKYFRNKN